METIVKALNELIPLSKLFIKYGFSEDVSASCSAAIVFIFVSISWWSINRTKIRYRNSCLTKNLYPQFDLKSIKEATKNYIPTTFQNASPTLEEEPGFTSKFIVRKKLIPFLLKDGFNEMNGTNKFHIVLADSGMGKTTFMVNLYLRYTSFWNFTKKKGSKIRLYRLGYPETLDTIKKVSLEEARNTILLLDALDEDPHIFDINSDISNEEIFEKRVDEIIEVAKKFKEVIFTCRTQYFPNQEDNPYELKVKRPDEKGYYILKKLYISPFSQKDINEYYQKEYPNWMLWKMDEKERIVTLVENTPKLTVRPMLLKYVKDLAQEDKIYDTTYSIYETLIEKWYKREANKRKFIKDREGFIKNLDSLSKQFAILIFKNQIQNKGLSITKDEAISIARNNNITLNPHEITGQSLLTCDGYNNWKFAHKSIFEYYVYILCEQNDKILLELLKNDFVGFDMTKLFFIEEKIRKDLVKNNKIFCNIFLPDKTGKLNNFLNSLSTERIENKLLEVIKTINMIILENNDLYTELLNINLGKSLIDDDVTFEVIFKNDQNKVYKEVGVGSYYFDNVTKEFIFRNNSNNSEVFIKDNSIKYAVEVAVNPQLFDIIKSKIMNDFN